MEATGASVAGYIFRQLPFAIPHLHLYHHLYHHLLHHFLIHLLHHYFIIYRTIFLFIFVIHFIIYRTISFTIYAIIYSTIYSTIYSVIFFSIFLTFFLDPRLSNRFARGSLLADFLACQVSHRSIHPGGGVDGPLNHCSASVVPFDEHQSASERMVLSKGFRQMSPTHIASHKPIQPFDHLLLTVLAVSMSSIT